MIGIEFLGNASAGDVISRRSDHVIKDALKLPGIFQFQFSHDVAQDDGIENGFQHDLPSVIVIFREYQRKAAPAHVAGELVFHITGNVVVQLRPVIAVFCEGERHHPETERPASEHTLLVIGEQTVGIDMIPLCEQSNKNLLLGIGQSGSTREAINKQEMENFKIPLPDSDVINLFGTKTDAGFKQIQNAILQTEKLLSIRNLLLSQL